MKKVLLFLLAISMVALLVACGDSDTADTDPGPADAVTADPDPVPDEADDEADDEPILIGVLMKTLASPYWQQMAEGLEAEVANWEGVEVEIFGAESEDDLAGQLALMENMINSERFDALAVAPITPTNLISGVVLANQRGLPVVNIDERFDMDALNAAGGWVIGYATSDNIAVGSTAAELIAERFPDGANIAIIEGMAGATSGELRRDGAINAFAEMDGFEILDVQPGDWDRQVALDVATNMILRFGDDLDAIFTANDTMAKGALQAMINTDRMDIFLVSTDADREVQEAIAEGLLVAVVQSPAGIAVECVQQAVAAVRAGYTGSLDSVVVDVLIPSRVFTHENIHELLDQ